MSVVIRTFNEARHIGRLLHGLTQQTHVPDEFIVVDSGSTDETVSVAQSYNCRIVHIDESEFSFGRSLNRGCEAATGDILLIVSAHVYPVYDTYVERMVNPLCTTRAEIVYGRQVGDSRTKFSESRIMLKWFPEESIWDQGHPFNNNANAALLRRVWEKYQYDEELTGLEDLDFAKRALEDGIRIDYVAEAPVVHVHEESWEVIRNRYRREAVAYRAIMHQTKFSRVEAMRLALANILSDYWHAGRDRQLLRNIIGIPRFRLAQFFGAVEGFELGNDLDDDVLRRFYYPTSNRRSGTPTLPGTKIAYSSLEPD